MAPNLDQFIVCDAQGWPTKWIRQDNHVLDEQISNEYRRRRNEFKAKRDEYNKKVASNGCTDPRELLTNFDPFSIRNRNKRRN